MHFVETHGYRVARALFGLFFAVIVALSLLMQFPVNGLRSDIVLILKESENTGDYATTSVGSAELLAQARVREARGPGVVHVDRVFRANGLMVVTAGYDTEAFAGRHQAIASAVLGDVKRAFGRDANVHVERAGSAYFYTRWLVALGIFVVSAIVGLIAASILMYVLRPLFGGRAHVGAYEGSAPSQSGGYDARHWQTMDDDLTEDRVREGDDHAHYTRDAHYTTPEMRVYRMQHDQGERVEDLGGRTHTYVGTSLGNVMTGGAYAADQEEITDEQDFTIEPDLTPYTSVDDAERESGEATYESSPFHLPDYDDGLAAVDYTEEAPAEVPYDLATEAVVDEDTREDVSHEVPAPAGESPRVRAAQAAPHNLPVVDVSMFAPSHESVDDSVADDTRHDTAPAEREVVRETVVTQETAPEAKIEAEQATAAPTLAPTATVTVSAPHGLPVLDSDVATTVGDALDAVVADAPSTENVDATTEGQGFVTLSDLATTVETSKDSVNAPQPVATHEPTQDELKERLNKLLRGEL